MLHLPKPAGEPLLHHSIYVACQAGIGSLSVNLGLTKKGWITNQPTNFSFNQLCFYCGNLYCCTQPGRTNSYLEWNRQWNRLAFASSGRCNKRSGTGPLGVYFSGYLGDHWTNGAWFHCSLLSNPGMVQKRQTGPNPNRPYKKQVGVGHLCLGCLQVDTL